VSRVRIKLCGITSASDAAAAAAAGADAIGMVFWSRSPRVVGLDRAAEIARAVPPLVARVGVFVDESPQNVAATVAAVGLYVVQLHGNEDAADYRSVGMPIVRAVSLASDEDVARAIALPAEVTVLVDAHDPEKKGGTGAMASWARAARVAAARPVMLAGGLTPANVAEAIRAVRPWAVDVSSGVESAPGRKDATKMAAFVAAVRSV
jgi:phosphoribosylanthranilate isomerase